MYLRVKVKEEIMRIRMFPDKNGGDWGPWVTILCILGIVFPPLGII